MQSQAKSVAEYLKELPEDRREAISAVRKVILKNIQPGFEEGMQYGMIGFFVPHSLYPAGYHCDPKQPLPYACLASQKNYMSLYMMSCYGSAEEEEWFKEQFAKAGKKLDKGKSCIRFKKLDDLPLDVIGEAFRRVTVQKHVDYYEVAIRDNAKSRPERTTKSAKKTAKPNVNAVSKKSKATKKAAPSKRKSSH